VLPPAPSPARPEPVHPSSTAGTTAAGQLGQDSAANSSQPDLLPDTATTDRRPASGGAPVGSHPTGAPVRPLAGPALAAPRPRWPWLLALLSLALLGYFGGKYFQHRGLRKPASGGPAAPAQVARRGSTFATGYYEVATDRYYYDLGPAVRLPLPTGRTLQAGANSTEAQLFYLLTNNANVRPDPAQAGICLDRVSFEAGTATLTAASAAQVTNLAALLQAYPSAQLKVGGFTDNQGRAEASLLRSADRANAVRQALLHHGLAPSRVAAQGYGQTHPLVSNATPAGRAQNRRVAILLLKK
jgi:OOP family OmpA-OmpF porin